MICIPGKCIKCSTDIIRYGHPLNNFCEIACEMTSNSILHIGICSACILEDDEFESAVDAISETLVGSGGTPIKGKIIRVIDRKKIVEILLSMQGGRCLSCLKTIDRGQDKFIKTNGMILHETCNPPIPKHDMDDPRALNVSIQEINEVRKTSGVSTRPS